MSIPTKMRAMLLEFPNDPACDYLDRQYMLGDALLVAKQIANGGIPLNLRIKLTHLGGLTKRLGGGHQ